MRGKQNKAKQSNKKTLIILPFLIKIKGQHQRIHNRRIQLTKELSKDPCEEAQVAGDVICHCRRKRFDNGVNAKDTTKKLRTCERTKSMNAIK